jgi:hypothetical protein
MPSVNQLINPTYQSVNQQGNAWTGYKPSLMTTSPYTKQQMSNFGQYGKMGMQGLQTGQMPGGVSFEPLAQQAMTQFNTQTIPSIASRFAGMGDTRNSSAFQSALGNAGAGLQENLAAMHSQYNMGMMPYLMQLLQMGQTPMYEQQYLPGQKGFLQSGGEQFLHGLGSAIPGFAQGGGFGSLMSSLKGLFGGGQSSQDLQQDPRAMLTALFKALQSHGTLQ